MHALCVLSVAESRVNAVFIAEKFLLCTRRWAGACSTARAALEGQETQTALRLQLIDRREKERPSNAWVFQGKAWGEEGGLGRFRSLEIPQRWESRERCSPQHSGA